LNPSDTRYVFSNPQGKLRITSKLVPFPNEDLDTLEQLELELIASLKDKDRNVLLEATEQLGKTCQK
jgi:hypothetical protein